MLQALDIGLLYNSDFMTLSRVTSSDSMGCEVTDMPAK